MYVSVCKGIKFCILSCDISMSDPYLYSGESMSHLNHVFHSITSSITSISRQRWDLLDSTLLFINLLQLNGFYIFTQLCNHHYN